MSNGEFVQRVPNFAERVLHETGIYEVLAVMGDVPRYREWQVNCLASRELRKVRLTYQCAICSTTVRMTMANDEMPEPPRHCMEDMDVLAVGDI